jgi:hypothetical protein
VIRASYFAMSVAVGLLSSWTLAYHIVALGRWPAAWVLLLFAVFMAHWTWFFGVRWRKLLLGVRREWRHVLLVLLIGASVGIVTLVVGRPCADDFNFFHRALLQVGHLERPFFVADTAHNVPGLPALSVLHAQTSYEMLTAVISTVTRADPFLVYHNVAPFFCCLLLAFVYSALFRELGFSKTESLAATAVAFFFISVLDWRIGKSWGRFFSFLWLGKSLLWIGIVPMLMLMSWRMLRSPSRRRWALVAGTVIGSFGLSGSALTLVPTMVGGVGLAYLANRRFCAQAWARCGLLGTALVYWAGMALFVLLGPAPLPEDMTIWGPNSKHPGIWWQNLGVAIGGPVSVVRDLILLLVVPWFAVNRRRAAFITALTGALCLVFANPVFSQWLIDRLPPNAYWRFVFLLPLPLCAGLCVRLGKKNASSPWGRTVAAMCFVAVVAAVFADNVAPREIRRLVFLKAPWQNRFPPDEWKLVQDLENILDNKSVLASDDIAWLAALGIPSARFEAVRGDTRHVFANVGQPEEGHRRVRALRFVSSCRPRMQDLKAFLVSADQNVDTLIFPECSDQAHRDRKQLLARAGGDSWREAYRDRRYAVLLKE